MRFEGIYTPIITPFNDDLSIDADGYAAVIDYQVASGINGIVIGGTTGESYALTQAERIAQFSLARDLIKGRLPWLAGVNDVRTEDVCALATAAREAGADGLLLGVPPYSLPTDEELLAHALKVDQAAGLPIMLYSYPGRSGTMMGEDFLAAVAGKPNFCAIKESSGELGRIHLLACKFPEIQLSCGADDQALEFFVWGAQSWVCGAGNFFPQEVNALYETCVKAGDFGKGRALMAALLPVMTVLERGGKFIQCVKYASALQGLPSGPVRPPMQAMDEALEAQMKATLDTARAKITNILAA
jgi:4-hydroxy-tetrahydrodipicolinate synthase